MELEKLLPWNANAPPRKETTVFAYANTVYGFP